MKILYFMRDITDCGGIQQSTCLTINSILDNNRDIKIYTVSLYHKYADTFFKLNSSVEKISLFNRAIDNKKQFFKIKAKLTNVLKHCSPDIIVIQGTALSNYLTNYAWKKFNVIVCEHGHYYMGERFGLHWFGKRKALRKADAIVTLTALDAQNYRKNNKRNIPITNIYNPNVCQVNPAVEYDTSSKIIVSCGTLAGIKRFEHAIEAARIIFKKYPNWQWYIYGDGIQKAALQQKIAKYNLENNVFLKGYEKDKNIIYGNKAFLVLTSKFEGFGMVLIEAMQFKLPVISYDINYGPKEIIKNGENGYLVKEGDINDLVKNIEILMKDSEKRAELSKCAFDSIDKFSLDKISNQWIEFFKSILKEG